MTTNSIRVDQIRVITLPTAPTLTIGDDSVTEGDNLQFTVSLSEAVAEDAVVTYSTADGSATTADSDYAGQTNQTLTIPAGQTSGTITIATTPDNKFEEDETLDVNLTGVLVNDSSVASGPIFWTDWTTGTGNTSGTPNLTPFVGSGTITTNTATVTVTYTNPQGIHFFQPGPGVVDSSSDYWQNRSDFGDSPSGSLIGRIPATSPFTSNVVENIPTGTDLIALRWAGSQTLTFSEEIANPVFSYVSLNGNGYGFDQDFEVLSFGDSSDSNDCGYFRCGTSFKNIVDLGGGNFEYQLLGGLSTNTTIEASEPHRTIRFLGAFDNLTWRSLSNEEWNGFTVGVQGTADEVGIDVTILDGSGEGTILNDDSEPPTLTTFGPVTFTEGSSSVAIDPDLTLTSTDDIDSAKVSIGAGFDPTQDILGIDGALPGGLTSSYNSTTGVLTISNSGSDSDYEAALQQVTYSNSSGDPDTADREITFSIGSGLAFPDNGHFYEFVSVTNLNWNTAQSDAAAKSLFGLEAYLATITSAEENAFVFDKLQGNGWLGGTDADVEGSWT